MKMFLKSVHQIVKVLVLIVMAYLLVGLFFVQNLTQLLVGLFVAIFIVLPTIFLFFFKNQFFEKYPKLIIVWKIYNVFYIIFIILFIILLFIGTYRHLEAEKTQKTIDFINSKKITMDDVMGKNLPPKPDQTLNNSTIAGIDANNNYIRDDVELAIFEKYPNSAKIRSAELQYAQALQLELTQVYNSETLVAVMKKESRGIDCIGKTGPEVSLKDSREKMIAVLSVTADMQKEIESLILNTDLRQKFQSDNLNKYMAGYSSPPGEECDVALLLLPS